MMKPCKFKTCSKSFRFFTPSIKELRKYNNLYLICLSNGGYDGLGKIREREMEASGRFLGFEEVITYDQPEF